MALGDLRMLDQGERLPQLIAYLPALFPDREKYQDYLELFAANGLRFIEIGIPPEVAHLDGSVIRGALQRVRKEYPDLRGVIEETGQRAVDAGLSGILMIYEETLREYGIREILASCLRGKMAGILVPNISEKKQIALFEEAAGTNLSIVNFIDCAMPWETIEKTIARTTGFLYLQAAAGGTGGQFVPTERNRERIRAIKEMAGRQGLPVALGFGINSLRDATDARLAGADAVIVGTAFVKAADESRSKTEELLKEFSALLCG